MNSGESTTKRNTVAKVKVLVDADVLIAGSASTTGASHIILQLCDLGFIEGIISKQVKIEAERNLKQKLPQALPDFGLLIDSALTIVEDPSPENIRTYEGWADKKDLPILTAALQHDCHYLITFNVRDYNPPAGQLLVQTPGDFLKKLREHLTGLILVKTWK